MRPILLLALLHSYIGWRVAPDLPGPVAGTAFAALLLANALLVPLAFGARRLRDRAAADRWTWAGMLALGLFSMLLVITLLRDMVSLLALGLAVPGIDEATA